MMLAAVLEEIYSRGSNGYSACSIYSVTHEYPPEAKLDRLEHFQHSPEYLSSSDGALGLP